MVKVIHNPPSGFENVAEGIRPEHFSDPQRGYATNTYKPRATPSTLQTFSITIRQMRELLLRNPYIGLYVLNNTARIGVSMPIDMEIIDKDGMKVYISIPATWIPYEITNADITTLLESTSFRRIVDNQHLMVINPFEAEHILNTYQEAKTELARVKKSAPRYEGFDGINGQMPEQIVNQAAEEIRESIRSVVDNRADEPTFVSLLNNIRYNAGSKLNQTEIKYIRENVQHEKVLDMLAML